MDNPSETCAIALSREEVDGELPQVCLCCGAPAVVSKTLGSTYGSPKKTVAPRPFPNTNQGTDCAYESSPHTLLFWVYVDPSPSASADLFARLKGFFGSGSTDVSGIGDKACMDKGHGLHVRKGKVRYYITGSANEKQVKDLGIVVARQL